MRTTSLSTIPFDVLGSLVCSQIAILCPLETNLDRYPLREWYGIPAKGTFSPFPISLEVKVISRSFAITLASSSKVS